MTTGSVRPLKMGIIGVGVGATQIMPSMEGLDEIELMAGADTNPRVREAARVYDSAEALCTVQGPLSGRPRLRQR